MEALGSDKECWLPVHHYPLYEVSSRGRVRERFSGNGNMAPGKILKNHDNGFGYIQVALPLNGRYLRFYVHRLVAEAFIGPAPMGTEINHIDRVRSHNYPENLEWVTHQENISHTYMNLLATTGYPVGTAKLREGEVWLIRKLLSRRIPQWRIGKMFKVDQRTISRIKRGESYCSVGY